jgi:hypothetical protein
LIIDEKGKPLQTRGLQIDDPEPSDPISGPQTRGRGLQTNDPEPSDPISGPQTRGRGLQTRDPEPSDPQDLWLSDPWSWPSDP